LTRIIWIESFFSLGVNSSVFFSEGSGGYVLPVPDSVTFDGAFYRKDIGFKGIK
jgi:hypothetical protein